MSIVMVMIPRRGIAVSTASTLALSLLVACAAPPPDPTAEVGSGYTVVEPEVSTETVGLHAEFDLSVLETHEY